MIFDADEIITVREGLYETWKIRKQDLADFLASKVGLYSGEEILERKIILSNINNVISIEEDGNLIILKPVGIKMRVNNSIIYLFENLSTLLQSKE